MLSLTELSVQTAGTELSHLRKKEYANHPNPLGGMCYIVSEALYHFDKGAYKPMNMKHEGVQHWFLIRLVDNEVVDLTADQFQTEPDYTQAVGRGFLTKQPSKRAQLLLNHMEKCNA